MGREQCSPCLSYRLKITRVGCMGESCATVHETGIGKKSVCAGGGGRGGGKLLNQNAKHFYINMLKIPALKRAEG